MTDNDKQIHQHPLPAEDLPPMPEEETEVKANRIGIGVVIGAIIGVSLGVVLGLIVFDNVGIGIGVGIALGIAFAGALNR